MDQSLNGPNLVRIHNKGHGNNYILDDDNVVMIFSVYNFISYAIKENYFCHDSSRIVWRGNG